MKKELIIILILFLLLTVGMHHKELFIHPLEHISHLKDAGAYGLGAIHPLVFTLSVYVLLWIPRVIVKMVKKKGWSKTSTLFWFCKFKIIYLKQLLQLLQVQQMQQSHSLPYQLKFFCLIQLQIILNHSWILNS